MGDALAWAAAKTVIQSMTQSIVNWINSGFEGSPAFVSDLNRNLGNLADAVAEDFLTGLDQVVESNTGFSIRAPFQDQINRALRAEFYRTTSSYGFNERYQYRDCYGGQGFNFNSFFCESQDAKNNPYGRYMLARNELFNTIDKETQNRLREIEWGDGFLSWRGPCGPYGSQASGGTGAGGAVNLNSRDKTYACPIRTPGAIIEQQLGITLTSPVRQLEIADSVNEIVAALMTQMVNQVLGGGGLSGLSQPSAGGGSSYIDRATSISTSLSGGFAASLTQTRTQVAAGQAGWQRVRDAASTARNACTRDTERRSVADSTFNTASRYLNDATTALSELNAIEAERVRLSGTSAADQQAVEALIQRFKNLLSGLQNVARGEAEGQDTGNAQPGSLYSQMTQLASECR